MSKASGLALILAGVGVAAYAVIYGEPLEPSASSGPHEIAEALPAVSSTIAATRESTRASEPAPATVAPKVEPAPSPPAKAEPAPAAAAPRANSGSPAHTVVVILPPPGAEPNTRPLRPRLRTRPADRATLARELQRELRRVGCYGGEVNGVWTTSTRRAMKAFTDRVNASLPIEQPDEILLNLVQNHKDQACGAPCPTGQSVAADGRCLPSAILAQRKTRSHVATAKPAEPAEAPAPAITGWSTTTTAGEPAPSSASMEGRMALAGPKTERSSPSADERSREAAANASESASAEPGALSDQAAHESRSRHRAGGERARRGEHRYTRARSREANWARSLFKRLESLY